MPCSRTSTDDYRLFCGDLGNEIGDDGLARAFGKYSSLVKARVIRDKKTGKTRGYGFVSFKDPQDFLNAMREMNGMGCVCFWDAVQVYFGRLI